MRACCVAVVLVAAALPVHSQSFEFGFDAPESIECIPSQTVRFDAAVRLTTSGIAAGGRGAEAWSFGVEAENGTIVAIDTAGTASERIATDTGDGIEPSFAFREVVDGGAVLAVILDTVGDPPAALDPGDSPHTLAVVTVATTIPSAGADCSDCTLRFTGELRGRGQKVEMALTHDAVNVTPTAVDTVVSVCASDDNQCDGAVLPTSERTVFVLEFDADNRTAVVPLAVDPDLPVLLTARDEAPDSSNAIELYSRWSEPASRFEHDDAATERLQAAQRLLLPNARAEPLFARVDVRRLVGDATTVELIVEQREFIVGEVTPPVASPRGSVTVTVSGAGFDARTAFSLANEADGSAIPVLEQEILSPTAARLKVDLSQVDVGATCRLDSTRPSSTTPSVLQVISAEEDHGLSVRLAGPDIYRATVPNVLTVEFENVSGEDLPAPLVKIVAPPGTELRFDDDKEGRAGDFFLFVTDDDATAGSLAPTAAGSLPLVIEESSCIGICEEEFQTFFLTATDDDFVGWDEYVDRAPEGIAQDAWNRILPRLSVLLGPTWKSAHETLATVTSRLALRKGDGASTVEAFRFVCRAALERPTGAIVGVVQGAETNSPLPGVDVAAIRDGAVRSRSVSDVDGRFVLDWLIEGETYHLRVGAFAHEPVDVSVPLGADVRDVVVLARNAIEEPLPPDNLNANENDLPTGLLDIPAAVFTRNYRRSVEIVSPIDPNEKEGPKGEGDGGFLPSDTEVYYTIRFENVCDDCAPARIVTITDQLPAGLDPASVRFRAVRFTGQIDSIESAAYDVETRANVAFSWRDRDWTPEVRVRSSVDLDTGVLTWEMETLDDDPLAGFLPPRDGSGLSEGHVVFSVKTARVEDGGPDIPNDNEAVVVFDRVEENRVVTNTWSNIVTASLEPGAPSSPVPADAGDRAVPVATVLTWQDEPKANTYDVYLWKNGDLELTPDDDPSAPDLDEPGWRPSLEADTEYRWFVVAKNSAFAVVGPTWSFRTETPPPECPEAPTDLTVPVGDCVPVFPVLSWAAAERASAYAVFVAPVSEWPPATPTAVGLRSTAFAVREFLDAGEYRWQVAALNRTCTSASLGVLSEPADFTVCEATPFLRGDANSDADVNITDPIFLLNGLFAGGDASRCLQSGNANGDEAVNISDPVFLLNFLFSGGGAPPAPYPVCGSGATGAADAALGCAASGCS